MKWLFVLLLSGCLPAETVEYRKTAAGNGHVDAAAIATDPNGNVWVVTNTTAFDLPVKNAIQPFNPASSIIVSEDAGRTWAPLGFIPDLPFTGVRTPAVHPRDSNILVASGVNGIYRSTDAGRMWSTAVDLNEPATRTSIGYIGEVEFDPRNPSIVYAAATGGVLKSVDAGSTWVLLTQGLAAGNCCTGAGIAIDPFQPQRLAYTINERAYVSNNSGATWMEITAPAGALRPFVRFDPFVAGLWYLYSHEGAYRSNDAGATWTRLPVETRLFGRLVFDRSTPGVLYALTAEALLRSADHGATWTAITPAAGGVIALAVQPGAPNVLIGSVIAGDSPTRYLAFRSEDAGATWTPLTLSRYVEGFEFDPQRPNRLYAAGGPTSKVHVMKLNPSGDVLFATYLGGQGTDAAFEIAIGLDGSAYISGTATSPDFTGRPARLYSGLVPTYFAVKLDAAGRLEYTSLFDGPQYPEMRSMAVDAAGVLHISVPGALTALAADGSRRAYTAQLDVQSGQSLAIAADGGVLVGGAGAGTGSGALHRFSPSGALLSTTPLPVLPRRIRTGPDGSVYVAGTASIDPARPVSEGAFQKSIDIECANNSGGIFPRPTLRPPYMTDVYIARLDPAGGVSAASYLGGACRDTLSDFAVGASGEFHIAGMTYSDPLPVLEAISGPAPPEQPKPFASKLDAAASRLLFSSYLDFGLEPRIAAGHAGALYVLNTAASGSSELRRTSLLKLTPREPWPLQIRNVTDAFQRSNTPISPVEIVSVAVEGLEPAQPAHFGFTPGAPLPIEVGDISVRFNGMPAPILAVSPGEIVCITPALLKGESHAEVQVKQGGTFSNAFHAELRDARPSFLNQVRNQNGTLNSPQNPAPVGSLVSFFLTGAGVPARWMPDGAVVDGDPPVIELPLVLDFAGTRIPLPPAQSIPGFVLGLYEVRVPVPPSSGTFTVFVYQAEGVEPSFPNVFPRIPVSVTSGTASSTPPRP